MPAQACPARALFIASQPSSAAAFSFVCKPSAPARAVKSACFPPLARRYSQIEVRFGNRLRHALGLLRLANGERPPRLRALRGNAAAFFGLSLGPKK